MTDERLLKRLPYVADKRVIPAFQIRRLLKKSLVLGVHDDKNPNTITLYPGPKLITQ